MNEKDFPNNKVLTNQNNHFTPSDHNAISRVTQRIIVPNKESLKMQSNDNKFTPSDEEMSSRKPERINMVNPKPVKHQIVNLCQSYIESVLFQLDSAPNTQGHFEFHNKHLGRIVHFTYFLDSSMNDNVLVNVDLLSGNRGLKSLINWTAGGNTFIKGTNNSMALNFKCNMMIKPDEEIRITYSNTSSQDCTIMAIADIKYNEEDFYNGTSN